LVLHRDGLVLLAAGVLVGGQGDLPAGSALGRVPGGAASDDGPEDASFGGDGGEEVLVELGGAPDVHGDE